MYRFMHAWMGAAMGILSQTPYAEEMKTVAGSILGARTPQERDDAIGKMAAGLLMGPARLVAEHLDKEHPIKDFFKDNTPREAKTFTEELMRSTPGLRSRLPRDIKHTRRDQAPLPSTRAGQ